MSVTISIKIDVSKALASLKAKTSAMADRPGLHGSIATAAGKLVKDHLTAKYLPRDGPRGDFWADVIGSTESVSDNASARVILSELGVSLRYNGGDVTPGKSISSYTKKLTKALAIPSDKVPVRAGRQIRPGRAGVLAFIRSGRSGETVGFLVEGETRVAKRGKNKGNPYTVPKAGGSLLYTLRTITRHRGDSGIVPTNEAITEAAREAIRGFLEGK